MAKKTPARSKSRICQTCANKQVAAFVKAAFQLMATGKSDKTLHALSDAVAEKYPDFNYGYDAIRQHIRNHERKLWSLWHESRNNPERAVPSAAERREAKTWAGQAAAIDARVLQKENERLRTEISQYRSGEAILRLALAEVLKVPPDLDYPPAPPLDKRKGLDTEVAVLHLSDLHIGKVTASYSTSVANERMLALTNAILHVTNVRRAAAKIEEIHVYLGGDIVEGDGAIFPKQAHLVDSSVLEQATVSGPSILARTIMSLAQSYRKVVVRVVSGNHGRPGSKHSSDHPKTCWDRVAYTAAKLMLIGPDGNSPLAPRLDFKENDTWYFVDNVLGWGNLVIHGDSIKGGFAGYPWYGTGRMVQKWRTSIPEPFRYVYLGHFHTNAMFTINSTVVLANGALESDNDYALQNMGSSGEPCQRLAFYTAKRGLISDNWIYVTDRTA